MKYGMEGYGLYWYCLELIAGSVEKHNITFELEHDAEIIAHDTGIHFERVQEMMTYMVNLGLFEMVNNTITCMKMASRADDYIGRIVQKSLQEHSEQTPNKLRTNYEQTTNKVVVNRIEEKRKERTIEKPRFAPPSFEDVMSYCDERKNKVNPNDFINFYTTKGWMVGKNKMKDWKAAIRTWESRESVTNEKSKYAEGAI